MNCIHTEQGIDKPICHTPRFNIGSNKSLWWVMELRNPFGETCGNLRMENNNPVITHFKPCERVAMVANTSCLGTVTLWVTTASKHSHLLGAVTFPPPPPHKPCSLSKYFSQPTHSTHPKKNYGNFISFPYICCNVFVPLINWSLEMAQLAPA